MVADKFLSLIGNAMPRIILGHEHELPQFPDLVTELAEELKSTRSFGQPIIREQQFPKTEAIRTTVIWDKWEFMSDEDRLATILQAYEEVEGQEFRDRLALAVGLTVPEAQASGILPVQVTTALRSSDPVTAEQCRDAMIKLGASVLSNPEQPVLRFATVEEAEECVKELVKILPGSDPVWVIRQEVTRIVD